MSHDVFKLAVLLPALAVLAVGIALCFARILRGPSHFDRVLAFDCLGLNVVGALLLLSSLFDTDVFIDAALVVLLLGFLGTMSLAAYLERTHAD
ncbi:monovalent cation/H+ antiporter complex subunit F [Polyangium sp. y55x31]|jgi:multisubunit Na+/H+ antiporter MnhF subunit|uniref:monovalent cation/H+ antiporter complex subunit F n=1 Tax=Polyangium sp. y55x31 TaxID=3042688 RepID=UPI002482D2A2|nr:monovalent cation/H+ antiporter complex subunit F [Polyangium sp. y55x31]MDI1483617.1 monovalent cation/H+ antiporter complex subunit F [Polyangium sp. y55x31]